MTTMSAKNKPVTTISTCNADEIIVLDKDLMSELIGKVSFTELTFMHIMRRNPTAGETAILDSVLVTLMEHGMTPSAIAARMVHLGSPDSLQGAVAAGLLSVGSNLVGTMEGMARNLHEIVNADEGVEAAARRIARGFREARKSIPGFGHPIHKPDDPRTPRLIEVAEANGASGEFINAMRVLSKEVDDAWGRHLTINATGAIGTVLSEIGIPWNVMRGIAVVSRAAGLVGHLCEEMRSPAAAYMWNSCEDAVAYAGERKLGEG
ncbi:MAG: citryl-CoA lyase [Alphaproteobacteria bacterium]